MIIIDAIDQDLILFYVYHISIKLLLFIESVTIVCSTNVGYIYQNLYITNTALLNAFSICEDCNKYELECLKVKPRIITVPTKVNAFEAICKGIKRTRENNSVNYYEAV